MPERSAVRRILSSILLNALWVVPIGLMIFARTFPDQFDRFWSMLFGE